MWCAHRDGIDRYLAVHRGDPGCDPARVRVSARENCRTGRVRWHRETGVLVAELLFDARLRAGDTYLFGYGFDDATGGPCDEYVRGFGFGFGQYVLQVGFDEAALPVRCRSFAQHSAGAPRGARTVHSHRPAPDRSPGGTGGTARPGRHRPGLVVSPFAAEVRPRGPR